MNIRAQWGIGLAAGWATALSASAGFLDHNFDAAPFTNGAPFTVAVSNWTASSASVMVTNGFALTPPHSVILPGPSAISNAVALSGPTVVWTDLHLAPCLGEADTTVSSNGLSFHGYFGTNGYLHIRGGGTWLVCTNDVWGDEVTRVTNGVFATLSVYQNFNAQRLAVLLNDQVLVQDLPFFGSNTAYNTLRLLNADATAWLDDAYVQATYATNSLGLDRNVDGVVDGKELQDYGYVSRTFEVGTGRPYTTLTAALLVARDRDRLDVDCSTLYTTTATITQSITLVGCSFTNNGTLTVAAGKTLTAAAGFTCSNLTVNGTLALAEDVVVSGSFVTVANTGQITVPTNALLLAGNLDILGSGTVVATGGTVTETGAPPLTLAGNFTLRSDGNWPAVKGLDFIDNFELYAPGSRLHQDLGLQGWGASTSNVVVQSGVGNFGKGVYLPEICLMSNRLATVGQPKIWTDFYLKPEPGLTPTNVNVADPAFTSYVASNGYLNVWSSNSWVACATYINGSNVTAMSRSAYARVTVFLNFGTDKAAVFVDGKLAREQVGFPAGMTIPSYSSFKTINSDGAAYFDDLSITTGIPADLQVANASTDLDGDGRADAIEIHDSDSLLFYAGPRTIFLFR